MTNDDLTIAIAGAVLGALITTVVLVLRRRKASSIGPVMRALAAAAARRAAEELDVTLDFSPESVEAVDAILARVREVGVDTDTRKEALTWGAYVGEVLVRQKGGRWERHHETVGQNTFPVHLGDKTYFPVDWCRDRIASGEAESIWNRFREAAGG